MWIVLLVAGIALLGCGPGRRSEGHLPRGPVAARVILAQGMERPPF